MVVAAGFDSAVERAVNEVQKVLGAARQFHPAEDVPHAYDDKYLLAEGITGGACAACLNALSAIGVNRTVLAAAKAWSLAGKAVTLRFTGSDRTTFVKEAKRTIESKTRSESIVQSVVSKLTFKSSSSKEVTEYFWNYGAGLKVEVYGGSDPSAGDHHHDVFAYESSVQLKTMSKKPPLGPLREWTTRELNLSWLLKQLAQETLDVCVGIDRSAATCHTPRRNAPVDAAIEFANSLKTFCEAVVDAVQLGVLEVDVHHDFDTSAMSRVDVAIPILPLLRHVDADVGEDAAAAPAASPRTAVVVAAKTATTGDVVMRGSNDSPAAPLSPSDLGRLLVEHKHAVDAVVAKVEEVYAPTAARSSAEKTAAGTLITPQLARVVAIATHLGDIAETYRTSVGSIEDMLRRQLIKAIGKEVTSADFAEYMEFHCAKVYADAYAPRCLSIPVRLPQNTPEGNVSLVQAHPTTGVEAPIHTISRCLPPVVAGGAEGPKRMRFELHAAATVEFGGPRYLHAHIAHKFSHESPPKLAINARAKQFSCYVLVLGTIGGAETFLPTHALLVQNGDDVKIPLDAEAIPTAKEFKDAIASLSPEQQRFAQAYRSMQLSATLFGVCVVHVKPHLEVVLGLPEGALAKEIKLTRQVLELLTEYGIPSDLLCYEPADEYEDADDVPVDDKVAYVAANVAQVLGMLDASRRRELEEARKAAEVEIAQRRSMMEEAERTRKARERMLQQMSGEKGKASSPGKGGPRMMGVRGGKGPMLHRSAIHVEAALPSRPVARAMSPVMNSMRAQAPPAPVPQVEQAPAAPQPAEDPAAVVDVKDPQGKPDQVVPLEHDVSQLPRCLEARYEALDAYNCLRPTILKPLGAWTKTSQARLLSERTTTTIATTGGAGDAQRAEKKKAFDLLDGLTRSGLLPLEHAELHVVVGATHCFDDTVMDTVVVGNVNPIERVEGSTLIIAAALHEVPPRKLLRAEHLQRVEKASPGLFIEE